ncbi:MAG: efflux transporter outer membrane subunit [Campylobacterales bacterium]|nr:efflux transporter outer membrane subunit [Campylobacterales bacterium]
MNIKTLLAVCLYLVVITGCTPQIDKATVISKTVVSSDLEKSIDACNDKESQLVTDWWKEYGDTQLNSIIAEAFSNAPSIKIIEARYAQANTTIESAQSHNLPHFSANASVVRERFSENHIFPPPLGGGSYTQYQPSLMLDYDFDFWNARESRILAAKNSALSQKATIEASKIALSSAICEIYLSWNFDEQKFIVLSILEKMATEELHIIEQQYHLGLIDAIAINDKKSSLSQVTQRLTQLKRVIEGKKKSICILGGFLPSYADTMTIPHIDDAFKVPLPKEIMLNLVAHRADVAIAKYIALSKSNTIEETKAQFYPNISLSGLIGFTSFNWTKLIDHSSYTPSTGIALSLPLLDWGERKANLQNSVSDYNSSVYEYNEAVIKAANEVVVLLKQYKLIESQRLLHEEEMNAKKSNEIITFKKLSLGLSNKLPYLSAKKNLLEGEIEILLLNETKSLIQIDLIKSLGGGYTDPGDMNAYK